MPGFATLGCETSQKTDGNRRDDLEDLPTYFEALCSREGEIENLFSDLLIDVTEFFRDGNVYDLLEKEVIPALFERKGSADKLRVWSVGCSTGEEAYSLAMLLLEEAGRREAPPQIQIFASDLHEQGLSPDQAVLFCLRSPRFLFAAGT